MSRVRSISAGRHLRREAMYRKPDPQEANVSLGSKQSAAQKKDQPLTDVFKPESKKDPIQAFHDLFRKEAN